MSAAASVPRTTDGAATGQAGQPAGSRNGASAWPSRWRPVVQRAAFVAAVDALALLGLVLVGDPRTQWWAMLLPLVLLAGPVTRLVAPSLRAPSVGHAGRLARFRRRRAPTEAGSA